MTPIGRNGEPTYKRIQNVIRKRIEAGQLKPGDMVASERELAKTHKVSLMTARHALADLAGKAWSKGGTVPAHSSRRQKFISTS